MNGLQSCESFSFSPDSHFLAIGDCGEVIRIWDAKTLQIAFPIELEGWFDRIVSISFSPDGRFLGVGGYGPFWEGILQLWNVETRHLVSTLDFPERVGTIAFSPDGCLLAGAGFTDLIIRVFVTRTQQPIATLQIPQGKGDIDLGLSFSPDGSILAAGLDQGGILLWKVEHN